MKSLVAKMWAIALVVLIGSAARADDSSAVKAAIALSNKACQEFKQQKAQLEHQNAQSQATSTEQKAQVTRTIAKLDDVIVELTAMLQDPILKTSNDKKEIAARLYSKVVEGNMIVRSAEHQLGVSPSSAVERVVDINIEPALAALRRISREFDMSTRAPSDGDGNFVYRGVGTDIFGMLGNNSAAVVVARYRPTTRQSANETVRHDGSIGGGVMLEDAAGGLGPVSAVKYDGRYNALLMDGRLVYFMKIPPWDAAALCRAISRDKNMLVGVSMGETSVVFGDSSTYADSDVAHDLMMTDQFLGDFVFGWRTSTKGYKFPNGYEPQTADVDSDMLVRFAFKNFQFTTKSEELQLAGLAVDVTMMPVSKEVAKNGGMLPDIDALKHGYAPPPEFLSNAKYLTSHFDFFQRERIVAKTLAYGELAALFRSYKQAGVNLEALASDLNRGYTK